MTKTGLEFGILVIVICLIFVICDLEFDLEPEDHVFFAPINTPANSLFSVL